MHQKILLVFILFIVSFTTGSVSQDPPEVLDGRRRLKQCYDDIMSYITNNDTNKICKYTEDFKNQIEEYVKIEKECFNVTLNRNQIYIDQLIFKLGHRYAKDYYSPRQHERISCHQSFTAAQPIQAPAGKIDTELLRREAPKKNLIKSMFSRKKTVKYTMFLCDMYEEERTITAIQRLEYPLRQFCADYNNFLINKCKIYMQDTKINPGDCNQSKLTPSLILIICISCVILLVLYIIIIIFFIASKCQRSEDFKKNIDKLPNKTNIS